MKIGIHFSTQQPCNRSMIAAFEEYCIMLRAVRDRGWDSVAVGHHYLAEGTDHLQLVPFLARLAAEAGHMQGITGVMLISLLNPVEIAENVATLDTIWKGNFTFGVGLGYRDVEFDAFKVPKATRVKRFEECLELVKRLWGEGEEDIVTFRSDYCELNGVSRTCRPVQTPRPPIWVAANSDAGIKRAARLCDTPLGDTWFINPLAALPVIKRQVQLFRAELESLDKPFPSELPIFREIFCARDKRAALQMAGPYLLDRYAVYNQWGHSKAMPEDDDLDEEFDELMKGRFIIGSPDECFEQLRPLWEDIGANHLILRTFWSGMPVASALSSIRLLSDEVLPRLREIKPVR